MRFFSEVNGGIKSCSNELVVGYCTCALKINDFEYGGDFSLRTFIVKGFFEFREGQNTISVDIKRPEKVLDNWDFAWT